MHNFFMNLNHHRIFAGSGSWHFSTKPSGQECFLVEFCTSRWNRRASKEGFTYIRANDLLWRTFLKVGQINISIFVSITYYIERGSLVSKEVGKLKYLLRFENIIVLSNFDPFHPPFPIAFRTRMHGLLLSIAR